MKDITEYEIALRDEIAEKLLLVIAPTVKGPQSLKSAITVCYDVAECFIGVRRAVFNVDKADSEAQLPLVVKS